MPEADLFPGVQLHVVTGKGGTGKSTVAAALALALASKGKQVLLCEVEGRQGIAQMFDVAPLPYEERLVVRGSSPTSGDVYALAIDAEAALLEYLAMYYRLGRAGKALDRFGVIDFATTIAPGVRDVLLTGKVYEAAHRNRRNKGARVYDAIVLDAPPTGRIVQFLNVNNELAGLAKVGPIKSQADNVTTLLRSGRTAVHLVTVLEEMPVQETIDGVAELRSADLPVGAVIVNLVRRQDLTDAERDELLDRRRGPRRCSRTQLATAGIEPTEDIVSHAARRGPAQRRAAPARGQPAGARRRDRRTALRAAAAGQRHRPRRALRAGQRTRRAGDRMSTTKPRVGPRSTTVARRPRHRRPHRRPLAQDHRVLRRGRRRQDHHQRGHRSPRRGARPQDRRTHHRPGPPAGPVDGHRGAGQHAAAGAGGRFDRRRRVRRSTR